MKTENPRNNSPKIGIDEIPDIVKMYLEIFDLHSLYAIRNNVVKSGRDVDPSLTEAIRQEEELMDPDFFKEK